MKVNCDLLEPCDKLISNLGCDLKVIHTYSDFVNISLTKNQPTIVSADKTNAIDTAATVFKHLNYHSSMIISCVDCSESSNKSYATESVKEKCSISEFLKRLDQGCHSIYWKDYHIDKVIDAKAPVVRYQMPEMLQDDWLNWYWKIYREGEDDYSFLYFGGNKTFTPIHHDVLTSYSWSLNVTGRKQWFLWHPSETHHLVHKDSFKNIHPLTSDADLFDSQAELVSDIRDGMYNCEDFPNAHLSKYLDIIQNENEIIFIPSGWHHMVINLGSVTDDQTCTRSSSEENASMCAWNISINRNWFNAHSIYENWLFLLRELVATRKELWHLLDVQPVCSIHNKDSSLMSSIDWHIQCDLILRANSAMNMKLFIELISSRAAIIIDGSFISEILKHSGWANDESTFPCDLLLHEMSEIIQERTWIKILCPNYRPSMICENDLRLCHLLSDTLVHSPPSMDNFLSTYCCNLSRDAAELLNGYQIKCSPSAFQNAKSRNLHCYPMTVLQFARYELALILQEMASSENLLKHMASILLADIGGEVTVGELLLELVHDLLSVS